MAATEAHAHPPAGEWDVIVVGSGVGGGTLARALATTGARILILERGGFVPREEANWSPRAVWKDLRYRTDERWLDGAGREFLPYMHYCVGGNSKFWGAVLFRMREQDFGEIEHADGVSPAWPIDYATLAPYYARAEQCYLVHGASGSDPTEPPRDAYPFPAVPHDPHIEPLIERLRGMGLHPSPLPLGLSSPGTHCVLCTTCNSFPCYIDAKSEAEHCGVRPATALGAVRVLTGAHAQRLLTDPTGRRVTAVEVERNGATERYAAPVVVVSCGAVNSAALLLRSSNDRHPNGLGNGSELVGRRYMAHLATMMQGWSPFRRNRAAFQKTVAINDYYLRGPDAGFPLGQLQTQGRTHPEQVQYVEPRIPHWMLRLWLERGVDWLALTEDLPRDDNRVTLEPDGRIRLTYRPTNVTAHRRLVQVMRRILRRLGYPVVVARSLGAQNTTHQCGTVCFGTDPGTSVLDPFCRAHEVENLFVVDASCFPSSAAVNPGLTIAANALRVADHIAETELGCATRPEVYTTSAGEWKNQEADPMSDSRENAPETTR